MRGAGGQLLLPIINMAHYQVDESVSCKELQAGAAVNNDYLISAVVLLDGQPGRHAHASGAQ